MAAATPTQPTKPAKKPGGKAAKKPTEKITSKADLIRKVAGIIEAKGDKPRPTEIVKILKDWGAFGCSDKAIAALQALKRLER